MISPSVPRRPVVTLAGIVTALACLPPGPATASDLYILGGQVHSLVEPARITDIVISGDTIVGLEPGATPGPDDVVIDARDMVVTPGLVDFASALGLVEVWSVEDTNDRDAGGDSIRAGFRVADGLNPQSTLVPVARLEGITSVVSRPSGGLIAGQSAWWDLTGQTGSEAVVLAPATMDFFLGASAARVTGGARGSAALRYRELLADLRAYLEDPTAYHEARMRALSLSAVDLEALAPVLEGRLPVHIWAHRQSDILAAITLAAEYDLRLILGGASEAWALADILAEREIPVVVNPLVNLPITFDHLGARSDSAARLDAAGVPVILTSSEAHRVGTLRQLVGNAIRAGMRYESALAAVTLRPARALGLESRYGSLAPGRVANVVVWSGDPFELSSRARHVIIRGRRIPLVSRQTHLLERYRELQDTPQRVRPASGIHSDEP